MRITSIELAGTSKTKLRDGSDGLPRAFARISRVAGDEFVTVLLLTSSGERTHHVAADCDEDIRSMADCLQQTLDGYSGTNSEFHEYYNELLRLSDL